MKPVEKACIALVIAGVIVTAGCGRREDAAHTEAQPGISFSAKNGLLVSPETARFIGLQVVEVAERKVPTTLQFSAQVYRASKETRFASTQPGVAAMTLASGLVGALDAASLRDGMPVTVSGEGIETWKGRITGLNHDLEKTSGQVEVLVGITDENGRFAKGAFVTVTATLGGEKNVVSVPRAALFHTTEGGFVYTVSGNHFVRTAVKTGALNREFAEIRDGLYTGDKVVAQPVMTLWLTELQSLRGGKACADGH